MAPGPRLAQELLALATLHAKSKSVSTSHFISLHLECLYSKITSMFSAAQDDINKQGYVFPLAYFHSKSPPSVVYTCPDEDYVCKV